MKYVVAAGAVRKVAAESEYCAAGFEPGCKMTPILEKCEYANGAKVIL
jgi:hypothetical protein